MENCLHCAKPLTHVPGRKEKSFCDTNCRNKFFYAKNKRLVEAAKGNMAAELDKSINLRKKAKDEPYIAPPIPPAIPEEVFPIRQIHNGEIMKQIEAIKAEKIPKERDTSNGRKSWSFDQQKRIQELQNKLK
jgi:hypothetical protein